SASFVSLVTYVIPIVAVILGVTVMQEHLTWISYLGTLMIFIGIMIVNNINPFIYLKTVNK
ncbi:MAG: EamA family transporter, partial [Calditrichaeota bacterium]|nr:EamA family transporter [Calditrichota bacterium]